MGEFIKKTSLKPGQWVSFEHLFKNNKSDMPEKIKGPIFVKERYQQYDGFCRCKLVNSNGEELDYLPSEDSISPWNEPWDEIPIPNDLIRNIKVLKESTIPKHIRDQFNKEKRWF